MCRLFWWICTALYWPRHRLYWLYWLTWTATLGTEFTADLLRNGFLLLLFGHGLCFSRLFPQYQFNAFVCWIWVALIKVITIIVFITLGLLVVLFLITGMKQRHCLVIWRLVSARAISNFHNHADSNFSGTELIGVAAGEAEDPVFLKQLMQQFGAYLYFL